MRRRMLKSKIHRATVSGTDIDYAGSISLDPELMASADIGEWEQVAVLDIDNGARFETYAIPGGVGEVSVNGAAARLVEPGHLVIVLTYADYEEHELRDFSPRIVLVDAENRPSPPYVGVGDRTSSAQPVPAERSTSPTSATMPATKGPKSA